jgi:hypothetical protein
MKTLSRASFLWPVLAGLSWLLASASGDDVTQFFAACGIFLLAPLGVWLTASAAATLPRHWAWRAGFWMVTTTGWLTLLLVAQGRGESYPDERENILLALGLACFAAAALAVKTRSLPTWRVLGEVAASVAMLALIGGGFAWCYDAKTRSIATRAEARWEEIGTANGGLGENTRAQP